MPSVAARLTEADAALRDDPTRHLVESACYNLPVDAGDHDEVRVGVLCNCLQIPEKRVGKLGGELRVRPRGVWEESPRETQYDDVPVSLMHHRDWLGVVKLRRDLKPLGLALVLGGPQLVEEVRGPMLQRVIVHVSFAIAMQLHALRGTHLDRLLDSIRESVRIPWIHAQSRCAQRFGAARKFGEDEHAAVLFLLAGQECVGGVRDHVPQRCVDHNMGLGE
mmetsp:Transcript_118669/g.335641  ORF Transcript_118669/g.335641 Transcript_118669/m.335641 type:complete len:221 (-) Transcript_118669:1613-2275(-)